MTSDVLEFLLNRRSSRPAFLSDPGPSSAELKQILTAASRVPDHKKRVPWRFILIEGMARSQFGEQLVEILRQESDEPVSEVRAQTERERFLRAPAVVCVVSCIENPSTVPEIEQRLSAGAACFSLCLAANALGYGTSWITEWCAFSKGVGRLLGLNGNESVAGFIYLGTASQQQSDRERPDLETIVSRWSPSADARQLP